MRKKQTAVLALLTAALTSTTSVAVAATPVPTVFIVSGKITDSSGAPFASGTAVRLYALPTEAIEATQAEGDVAQETLLASTTTSSTGAYSLTLQGTKLLRPFRNRSGLVNLQVLSQNAAGEVAEFDFTRWVSATSDIATTGSDADGTSDGSDSETDNGTPLPASDITSVEPAGAPVAARVASPQGTQAVFAPATQDCEKKLIKRWNAKQSVVGAAYVTTSDGGQAFTYTQGSSTHIGVEIQLKAGGAFKANGSKNIDGNDTSTNKFGQVKGIHSYRYTQNFDIGRYALSCSSFPGGSKQFINNTIEPIRYSGPNVRVNSSPPTATHCTSHLAFNSSYELDAQTATTYSAGVNLGVVGDSGSGDLLLTARSGYSSGVTAIFYNNSQTKNHDLCGTRSDVGHTPGRVVLK